MDNIGSIRRSENTFLTETLREGKFFFPAHDARVTPIDARDLADVAVRELLADRPFAGVLSLTGPETLDFNAIAQKLSSATGREIAFVNDVSPDWSEVYAGAVRKLFEHYRTRGSAPYTHTVKELLGRNPRTIEQFGKEVLLPLLSADK
ncbi:hypothetical protein [Pseudomonas extremaustralis]|uniref:hypothetical protein n=1 Tax=Pseudomonas extremaustralis TaxID=359110 RepID=UPI00123923FB|nr:hypothetical protein [Pseudomonas extremaustralis]